MLIISDILVLWSVGASSSDKDNGMLEQFLKISRSIVNAAMSLLVSSNRWRSAGPAQRQAILAGLISKVSLILETGVGGILIVDLLIGFMKMIFGSVMGGSKERPAWYEILTKLI